MSYTPNIPLELDPVYTGMAADLRAQLYDGATGDPVGSEISGGFTEMPGGGAKYIFRPSIPSGHDGWCRVYPDGMDTITIAYFSINPVELEYPNDLTTTEIVDAITAYEVETGHSFDTVLKRIYAVIRGDYLANNAGNPTEILFYAPDGTTVRVTFALSANGTVRSVS